MSESIARAAVALITAPEPEQVLLIQRARRAGDPWAGHWALPGGRREETDRDLIATARRETAEEVSLHLPDRPTSDCGIHLAGRAVGRPVPVAVFHWRLDDAPVTRAEASEVAAIRWLPLAALHRLQDHRHAYLAPARPQELMPCLPIDDTPLWGFTYQVLMRWLELELPPPDRI